MLAGLVACGGLAEDGPQALVSAGEEPEATRIVSERQATAPPPGAPQPRLESEESAEPNPLAGSTRVGQACGPPPEQTQSLVVGDVELQRDARCGAGSACLVRAPEGSSCRASLGPSSVDCADLVPVPPRAGREAAWQEDLCSCRCDGSARNVEYCNCPGGMRCAPLIPSSGANAAARPYVGSYCVY